MDNKSGRHEEENIKKLVNELRRPEVSKSALENFSSRLAVKPDRKKRPGFSDLKRSFYYKAESALDGIQDVLKGPVPALAGALAVVFTATFTFYYGFAPQKPLIHNIKGMVKVFDGQKEEWLLASENMEIRENDIIKTFKDGSVDVSLKGTYSMRLKRDSEVRVIRLCSRMGKSAVMFTVEKGKIFAYYNSRAARGREGFEIRTPEAVAAVMGTDFMLEQVPALQKTWLGVLDGVVRVTSTEIPEGVSPEEATVFVRSRYKTETSRGKAPTKPEIMVLDEWLELEELYALGIKPQVALLISTGSTRTRELLSMLPLYISDKEPSVLPDRITKLAKTFNQAIKERSEEKHARAITEFEDIVRQYPNPVYNVQFLLFIGAYYEYLEDHKKAIDTFESIIKKYPQSSLASIAQCAIGIIYEEKLGNREKAREAYRKVVSDYPESPEREEASAGLERLSN